MILLTGATGLVGGEIANQLLDFNLPFKAFKRSTSRVGPKDLERINWVDGDVLDPLSLKAAFGGIDTIIHSAAIISFYPREYDLMFRVNVEGTANMINEAINAGVKRFVHISSVAAIGRSKQAHPINETSKWTRSPHNSAYGESKHLAELEVWRGQEEGLSVVIVNPSVVLGPGDWERSSTRLFKYAWNGGRFYPPGSFNYVDLRDVGKATVQLMNSGIEGDRFIISYDSITYKKFFGMVARKFGKKVPTWKLTKLIVKLAIFREAIKSWIFGSAPLITRDSINLSSMTYVFDNTKIKKALDFEFTPLSDTIAWTCKALEARQISKKI